MSRFRLRMASVTSVLSLVFLTILAPLAARAEPGESATVAAWQARRMLPVPHWSTLTTTHFRVHFYESEANLASQVGARAERAYDHVSRYLDWQISGRVDITLADHTDAANGFANSTPFNHIVAYAVAPQPFSTLSDYDDWVDLLVTHELSHVVHLDTVLGLPRLLDAIFGKLLAPNLVQPSWFIEGFAVLMESRFTSAGRIRSTAYDMFLRTAVLENRFLDLANVSNAPSLFPYAEAAYLYGSSFLKYLEDRFGPEKVREMSFRYGRKLLPLSLNRTAQETFGHTFDELYGEWHEDLRRRYGLVRDEVLRNGLREGRRLTFQGESVGDSGLSPRFWGDSDHVLFQQSTSYQRPGYQLLDLRTGTSQTILSRHTLGPASPAPNGHQLVLEAAAALSLPRRVLGASHSSWDDLFRFDKDSGTFEALTVGHRAHEPDVSPDGRRIACTVGSLGGQQLALVPFDGGAPEVIRPSRDRDLAFSPAWSPDGHTLAYVHVSVSGAKDIHLLDLENGDERALTDDRAADTNPRFSADGRYVVFASDRSGISNIFAFDLMDGRLVQLTNVIGGAFQPAVSPDGRTLVYAGFSSIGLDLYAMPFAPHEAPLAAPALDVRPPAPPFLARPEEAGSPAVVRDYQGWRYLYPRTWQPPTISSNDLGLGAALGLSLAVSDPAALHDLSLSLSVPTSLDTSAAFSYAYHRFWPSLGVSVARAALTAHDLVLDGRRVAYRQHTRGLVVSVGLPVHRTTESSADVSLYYRYADYRPADALPTPTPFQGILKPPEVGPVVTLGVEFAFSNAHAWNRSISAQEGRNLSFGLSLREPPLGSRFHGAEAHWGWTEYFTPPWSNVHALALLYAGGMSTGDKSATYALGGFTQQDVVRSLFLQQRQCCLFLRGYAPGSVAGDRYHLFSAEYRAPLAYLDRGVSTFPVFLRRLHGATFADAGQAFSGDFRLSDLKTGVGAELRLDLRLFYSIDGLVQLGVAKGLASGGSTTYYWVTSAPF